MLLSLGYSPAKIHGWTPPFWIAVLSSLQNSLFSFFGGVPGGNMDHTNPPPPPNPLNLVSCLLCEGMRGPHSIRRHLHEALPCRKPLRTSAGPSRKRLAADVLRSLEGRLFAWLLKGNQRHKFFVVFFPRGGGGAVLQRQSDRNTCFLSQRLRSSVYPL